jgi:hypothetical protein
MGRPAFALDPKLFGRGRVRELSPADSSEPRSPEQSVLSNDIRLFATTFAAGFLVVSILIG